MNRVTVEPETIERQLESFFESDNLIGLRFYRRSELISKTMRGDECLVFADNEMSFLCLSTTTGNVWIADDENEPQFVNSDFDRFVECLKRHRKLLNFEGNDDSHCYEAGQQLESFIAVVDPPALEGERFWAMILEELISWYEPIAV